MTFDVVVFTQEELNNALKSHTKSICLCDGSFVLPYLQNTTICAIGDVCAKISMTKREAYENNVCFHNLKPTFAKHKKKKTNITSTSLSCFACKYNVDGQDIYVNGYGVNLI